jgi:hypothetical protein
MKKAVVRANVKWINLGAISLLKYNGIKYNRSRFMG